MKVLGLAGWSGAGKTTLIEKLIPLCVADGLKVTLIKQAHHDVDIDQPGKDSWRARQAGAHEVLLASGRRWALMHEIRDGAAPGLQDLLARLALVDLVLVEGYKREAIPKLEVHRSANNQPWLYPGDAAIVAVASDVAPPGGIKHLDLNDAAAIYRFIRMTVGV